MKPNDWILVTFLVFIAAVHSNAGDIFFFNETSVLQVSSGTIPLTSRFYFSFRTCHGGILLFQAGNRDGDYIVFQVSAGKVNYNISVNPPHFTPSYLTLKWKINGVESSVHVGNELDKNFHHKVTFTPGSGNINSTISIEGPTLYSASVPNSIQSFTSGGPLYAGGNFDVNNTDSWFLGCIESGTNIPLSLGSVPSSTVKAGCPLDGQTGCPDRKPCSTPGFTGYYCEININDCPGLCNIYSKCVDGINNYTCICGPRWTGRNCEKFLGSFCDETPGPCNNSGVCQDTSASQNNYTCICQRGWTGRNCNSRLDPCDSLNCRNGGTCQRTNNGTVATCVCQTGFNGLRCENNIDDCARGPCLHGGVCADSINNFTCNCTGSGYDGLTCTDDIDECNGTAGPCLNGATCSNYIGTYTCKCKDGYGGSNNNCEEDINECNSNPCRNGGTCIDGVNGFNCTCPLGYNGTRCGNDIDECVHNTCNQTQVCVDQINSYACVCRPGYTGVNCSVDIKECHSNLACQHGGTCHEGVNSYNCTCLPRFNGTHCEFDSFDDCHSNPCLNNGTCKDDVGFFKCSCPTGYLGARCENKSDSCYPIPCENGGVCSILNGSDFNCTCAVGFTGKNCSGNIDDCSGTPCVQNATCIDGINNFTCQCPAGFHGNYCELDIDECGSSPCQNNATCENELNRFTCKCVSGFNGSLCENNINDCPAHGCYNGTCRDGINNYTCVCNSGFKGEHCEKDIDECLAGSPCQNSGTCINSPGSYRCVCNEFTNGTHCELDIDECAANTTCNGFKCDNYINTGYQCYCNPGYTGKNCREEIDECRQKQPCKNGATCIDRVFAYTCVCWVGWTGKDCDEDVDECALGYCKNSATCYNTNGAYNCTCVPGYTDYNCSTDIDECATQPCVNRATCNNHLNFFNCTCAPGYTGFNCSEEIDECQSFPCRNNATCTDLINGFNCSCPTNYTGSLCQYRVSRCLPINPCLNNGSCEDQSFGNYTCNCVAGFGGHQCQNITTIGVNGSSYMAFGVGKSVFTLSLQFRTTLQDGALVIDSGNKLLLQLKGGALEISNETAAKTVGSSASLTNGQWHQVTVNITSNSIEVNIDNSSCGDCQAVLSRAQTTVPKLFIGGGGVNIQRSSNLIGCVQDVKVDGITIIPTQPGVDLVNITIGCARVAVCQPHPCTHGQCVDEWVKYRCDCDRKWTGSRCNTSLIAGTFGAQAPLNQQARRLRRDVSTIRNASFAKFSTQTTFTIVSELSFYIRTRQSNGLIALLTDSSSNHVTVELKDGAVFVQLTSTNGRHNRTSNSIITDGNWHFISISANRTQIDNSTYPGIQVPGHFNLTVTYIGGLEDFSAFSDEVVVTKVPLSGCLQDARLNNKLFQFFAAPSSMDSYPLLSVGRIGQGCPGEDVCTVSPCGMGGQCKDMWNRYQCQCHPRYGGSDCSSYGCTLVRPCPRESVCSDVDGQYECAYPATFNGSLSHAEFTFASNITLSPHITFMLRTRQNQAVVLLSRNGNDVLKVTLDDGRVNITYSFGASKGTVAGDVEVNDGAWHNVTFNATSGLLLTVDGSQTSGSGDFTESQLRTLLNSAPVRIGLGVDLPYKGCLDNLRVGGALLPFISYYNASYNVGHVTSLKPRFKATTTSVPSGCHGDDVCEVRPCVRGRCSDIWDAFHCACPVGYAGLTCNLTANMTCAHQPCYNNAMCENRTVANLTQISDVGTDGFVCICQPGYEGRLCKDNTDECTPMPCLNGGNCTDIHLNYTCSCVKGFEERNCETNIDDCLSNNCTNNATCIDLVDGYNCSCTQGFNGTYCGADINECLTRPCASTGTKNCTNTEGSYKCECNTGYYGNHCQYNASQWCPIASPCKNGNCSGNSTGFYCTCAPGWTGTICAQDINECQSNPCRNNGTCTDSHSMPSQKHFPGYTCNCTVDWTGSRCKKQVTPCDATPCRNGSCIRLAYNIYECNCTEGFGNVNCSGLVEYCTPNPCTNGRCVPLMDGYRCECSTGYQGWNCNVLINKCHSNPCQNGGSCNSVGHGYTCACEADYVGTYCEVKDPCNNEPACENGASCVYEPKHQNYTCNCTVDWTGSRCKKQVTPCDATPCRNGSCIRLAYNIYECNCTEGFGNVNCSGLVKYCTPNPCTNGRCVPLMDGYRCVCSTGYQGRNCNVLKCHSNPCASEVDGHSDATVAVLGTLFGLSLVINIIFITFFVRERKYKRPHDRNPAVHGYENEVAMVETHFSPAEPQQVVDTAGDEYEPVDELTTPAHITNINQQSGQQCVASPQVSVLQPDVSVHPGEQVPTRDGTPQYQQLGTHNANYETLDNARDEFYSCTSNGTSPKYSNVDREEQNELTVTCIQGPSYTNTSQGHSQPQPPGPYIYQSLQSADKGTNGPNRHYDFLNPLTRIPPVDTMPGLYHEDEWLGGATA